MHAAVELTLERGVDHAVRLDAAFATEGLGDHPDPEMRIALRTVPRVALVKIGFVDHIYADRTKSLG